MTFQAKILAFAGSLREDSFNKKLARQAGALAEKAGAQVTFLDLRDFALPIYNQDIEASTGLPDAALELKELFSEHQGFLISSPEYNSSYSAALKNTIDWVSRPASPDEPGLKSFRGKIAGLMSASPGALGGLRGLFELRSLLMNIHVMVLPTQVALSSCHGAFDEEGGIKIEAKYKAIKQLSDELVTTVTKMHQGDS